MKIKNSTAPTLSKSSLKMFDKSTALLLIDLQNDFCPGGHLAVAEGDQTIAVANSLIPHFSMVIATKDWHPQNHKSFASNHHGKNIGDVIDLHGTEQVLWPDHCVENSFGAEFHSALNRQNVHKIIHKGSNSQIDSYSAFYENDQKTPTELVQFMATEQLNEIYLMGLATDYCVLFSALDSRRLNLKTTLIVDGCRAVNLQQGDHEKAIEKMQNHGVRLIQSAELLGKSRRN